MILINNVIVNDEVVEENFACNLNACKGACCWEGDYGAPLENHEIDILESEANKIAPYLDERSVIKLGAEGGVKYFKKPKFHGTNLHEDGACIYLNTSTGISMCGIEQAWKNKDIEFRKPISCHLYPIRIEKDHRTGFETMNYDRWDICSAACTKGKEEKITVAEFAKEAIIRKYGQDFYDQLEGSSSMLKSE